MDIKPKVIVSLTSFPNRFLQFDLFKQCLESLVNQKTKYAYKIVLTLFKDDILKLTSEILQYCRNNNIEILPCEEDIRGHKKYFYIMQKYPDIPIITVDDDIVFYDNLVDSLYKDYLKNKNMIYAGWPQRIKLTEDGFILPTQGLHLIDDTDIPSFNYKFGSGSGTLFPPYFITDFTKILNLIKQKYLQYHDESLLKKIANDKGLKIAKCVNTKYQTTTPFKNQFVDKFIKKLSSTNSLGSINSSILRIKLHNCECKSRAHIAELLLLSNYKFLGDKIEKLSDSDFNEDILAELNKLEQKQEILNIQKNIQNNNSQNNNSIKLQNNIQINQNIKYFNQKSKINFQYRNNGYESW